MDKFKTVLDLYLKHRSALGYGLVTLLTAGGEKIFSAVVFQCPCSAAWNLPYGLVFLLVPALALFLLGYVLSARTWRLLTGCCERARGCARPRGALLPLVPCGQATPPTVQDLLKELKAQSQVLGWVLIAGVIILLLICTSVTRCLSPISYLQLKFWKIYSEKEQQILKSQATEHATELAKENIKCFFEGSRPNEYSTPSIKDWQQISSLYTFNPKDQYYSILHKYVNRKEKSNSIRSVEGDSVIPVLGFVDSSGISSAPEL
ncbi:Protein FAM26F [Heterocephalus glaber]|uniref:Protein FAM26F n=1 Tax=Heterocephalus glaber TaxID=10181 RepID=G5C161_HETGA|nr:Protein FAM26F [Heterocephalus glaber]